MTESTALFLARLSHQWFLMALLLPVVFSVTTHYVGVLWERNRVGASTLIRRSYIMLHAISYALLVASIGICGIAFFHVGCAALKSHGAQCMSNLKQLSLGALQYAQDYDERLPASAQWAEAIHSQVMETAHSNPSSSNNPFQCPSADSPASYGMNVLLGGISLSEMDAPADTILIFDANAPIRSFAGRLGDVAQRRHNGGPNIAYADGHVRWANAFGLREAVWTPIQENSPQSTAPIHGNP